MTNNLAVLAATEYARQLIAEARAAKAKGRASVASHYVRQARAAMRVARQRSEFGPLATL
jgi:hypothetical protein